eukprot:201449-Chlamydomonas_euryale.AAC.7
MDRRPRLRAWICLSIHACLCMCGYAPVHACVDVPVHACAEVCKLLHLPANCTLAHPCGSVGAGMRVPGPATGSGITQILDVCRYAVIL